jgi:hypothetical protein
MKIKDLIFEKKEPPKPRNFVAKNAKTSGAGAHKDKKKAEKQGDVKHKKQSIPVDEGFFGDFFGSKKKSAAAGELKPYMVYDKFTVYYDPSNDMFVTAGTGEYQNKFKARGYSALGGDGGLNSAEWYGIQQTGGGGARDPISINKAALRPEEKVAERFRDPEDWDEGNTEPPNNMAVYINGKKWKVFPGRGQYADDKWEMKQYYDLQAWAQRKSDATGKKWEVFRTGEPPTAESIEEKAPPGFKGTVKAMKKHKEIDNPFALAWSMKNKGYKSHKKADGSDK